MILYPAVILPMALNWSSIFPTKIGNKMPPTAPAIPPIPTTELTASFGNMSEAKVNILVAHAWCIATARLNKATAIHACDQGTQNRFIDFCFF